MPGADLLTDKAIKAALKTAEVSGKARKLSDGAGMVLEARPTGTGWWRLRYWRDGREGMLSLGTYPETGLRDARDKRDAARKLIRDGVPREKLFPLRQEAMPRRKPTELVRSGNGQNE